MTIDPKTLTLQQKAALLSGRDLWSTKALPEADVPSIIVTDGPHGVRLQPGAADHLGINGSLPATCFPPAVAVGSSWDPEVAAQVGAGVGREGRALGVAVVLGPGVNIKRSPLCGRNFEYYSEDPYLSGVLGAAHIIAQQAQGVGASLKHFAANNQETERMRISADIDERTMREIYLPAFERAVRDAKPATVMAAYNKVNGIYSSENRWLLTDVLRNEWGFEGAVVSDWGAVNDRVAGLVAGMDLEMPGNGGLTDQQIIEKVQAGELDETLVDRAVARVLSLTEPATTPVEKVDTNAHHALARRLAAESAVLLKNDNGTLPLGAGVRIAVIGEFAVTPRFQGGGSSHINATRADRALDAIRSLAAERDATVAYAPGFALNSASDADDLRATAISVAGDADVAVIFAGLSEDDESEGFDRDSMDLPENQSALIRAVAAAAPRTVVVLSNGGVLSLEGWHDDVDSILEGWLLGQGAGEALAELLFGVVNPSGHLAETIPLRLEDNPSWSNFPGEQGHVRYGEGVLVGYRYYETAGVPVRYPFGHGLSYTTFGTDAVNVDVTGDDTALVRVTTTNTGQRAGKHVIQVYVSTDTGPVRRPARELRAFAKVDLEPGESTTMEFSLDRRAFAYWDVALGRWVVPGGEYRVQVGDSVSAIGAESTIVLTGDRIVSELTLESSLGEFLAHPVVGPMLQEGMTASATEDQKIAMEANPNAMRMAASMPMRAFSAMSNGSFPLQAVEELIAVSRSTMVDA